MTSTIVLGIDIGTTSSKAVARPASQRGTPYAGAAHPVAHRR